VKTAVWYRNHVQSVYTWFIPVTDYLLSTAGPEKKRLRQSMYFCLFPPLSQEERRLIACPDKFSIIELPNSVFK